MKLRIHAEPLVLDLKDPFTLSYGTTRQRSNVLVRLVQGRRVGLGEAALPPYTDQTAERVHRCLADPALLTTLDPDAGPPSWQPTLARIESVAARAALEIALHDLWGQGIGQPLHRIWSLEPRRCPTSSFTVAMDADPERYRERLRGASSWPLVKVKLGSGDVTRDLAFARTAREELPGSISFDANGGWTAGQASWIIPRLAELGQVAYIEQPVAREDWEGWRSLRASLPPPTPLLIADESVQGPETVAPLAGLADGINIKLVKCGGIGPARRMIADARTRAMVVMLGCMVESSVAVTAAAHLAPAADLADLDGNLLLAHDPFVGVTVADGRLTLPDLPGLGVRPRAAA